MPQTIQFPTSASLDLLLSAQHPPCLSLYQPTHRHRPDNQQDPLRFRNLVKQLEVSLREAYSRDEIATLLKPFEALALDLPFWDHTLDGLAVLASDTQFQVFQLQRNVPEMAIVASSFHTKPLRRFLQSVDRYQILGLSMERVQLFEGNRDAIDEIELAPGVPLTLADALGSELTESHQTVASYGGAGHGTSPMHHASGGRKDEVKIDTERFFRVVDRAIARHHSRPSGLPLILAALPQHHHLFHQVSHNPFLAADSLDFYPASLPLDVLRQRAWQLVAHQYEARWNQLSDAFANAKSGGLASDSMPAVAFAAANGRVATLLIESDRQIAGRLNCSTGEIESADLADPQVDDLLDDLGALVLKMGGSVFVLPAGKIPASTGLAAIYRF